MPVDHLPVLLALGVALGLGGVILLLSSMTGSRSGGRIKLSPYESGEPLLDRSRKRISIVFFLIAIDFVIFDVEAAFLYPWVLVMREGGWPLFEVFIRSKQGLSHVHAGSLHAADAKMAIENARDVYTRRSAGTSIWVVPSSEISASAPEEKGALFDPADSKIYRHPTFYTVPDDVECL